MDDAYESYISNAKPKAKNKKKKPSNSDSSKKTERKREVVHNLNVKAIKEHDANYLKQVLNHEPIVFENKNEFWDYIYSDRYCRVN